LPSDRSATHLQHILGAIDRIDELTRGMDQKAYEASDVIKLAVERLLQNLTEAAHRLGRQADAVCPGVNWRVIRDLGNVLRHDYDELLDSTLWNTITVDLPPLKAAVRLALERITREVGKATP
jgi:uncharacterized protein with HEPN domain